MAISPGDGVAPGWLEALAGAGVPGVVLREPGMVADEARGLVDRARALGLFVVAHTKTPDAHLLGADALHLPDDPHQATAVAHGRSCHDANGLQRAWADGAGYAFLSPVWPPTSKRAVSAPLGVDRFLALAGDRPVLALGGITALRLADLRRRGAYGGAFVATGLDPTRWRALAEVG
jgi:thiamine monophosphate synthase